MNSRVDTARELIKSPRISFTEKKALEIQIELIADRVASNEVTQEDFDHLCGIIESLENGHYDSYTQNEIDAEDNEWACAQGAHDELDSPIESQQGSLF